MKKHILLSLLMSASAMAQTPYEAAKATMASAPESIQNVLKTTPETYTFNSVLGEGSSVSYTGQTFRLVLINDLKSYMGSVKRGDFIDQEEALGVLNSYYEFNYFSSSDAMDAVEATSEFKTTAKHLDGSEAFISEGFFYGDLKGSGKNLKKKMAGIDNPLRRGSLYGVQTAVTADDYVQDLFSEFALNAAEGESFLMPNGNLPKQRVFKAGVTKDGRDLTQLVQKFFHGSISYNQAARDYLSTDLSEKKGLNASNDVAYKPGKNYTKLEHHFDEGFGYFGAAVDYKLYTHKQIKSKLSRDTNNDGDISIESEMNLGLAVNSAKRDLGAKVKTNFKNEAIDAFLQARHLITQKPEGYRNYVIANANIALGAWEKTIASSAVHYINKTVKEMNEYGTEDYLYTNFAKYWSELKGFAMALQFSPIAMLSDADFDKVHALIGDKPVLPSASKDEVQTYQAQLMEARLLLQNAYKFNPVNAQNW